MRVNTFPEPVKDLPPPPYTPDDPVIRKETATASPQASARRSQMSIRGGYMRPSPPSEIPSENANFSSAPTYHAERQPSIPKGREPSNLVEHNITLTPDTTRDDLFFPHPIESYIDRDVTSLDWSTFVSYLFPVLDQSSNGETGNEKGFHPRTFIEEDTPERRQRIKNVVAQWNEGFFSLRLIHINISFETDFASASSRSLPASTTSNNNTPIPFHENGCSRAGLYNQYRRQSSSSTSSSTSSSSSSSSVDSINSADLSGADANTLRSALLAFRLDPTNKDHLWQSIRQLHDEFCSQRHQYHHSDRHERKRLKQEFKDQRNEIKREVKAVVKEIKYDCRADRKYRKAERKTWRKGKWAENRALDRVEWAQAKCQRKQERAEEKVLRAQARGIEAQERAAEQRARQCGGVAVEGPGA